MRRILFFTLILSALMVCGCSKDNESDNEVETTFSDVLTVTVNDVTFQMVYVEGGTFTMGATAEQGDDANNDEKPAHSVTLNGYYIGQTEVTQALWNAVMRNNPSEYKGDDLPVENVSWDDCQMFVRSLNYVTGRTFRLPTEAEWEYAARGGSKSRGYKYSGSDNLDSVAWHFDNFYTKTNAVAAKAPNELGLYDMSGNVCEWCWDLYGDYSSSAQYNPMGSLSGDRRVIRGGGWISLVTECRVSDRYHYAPDDFSDYIGLRLVLVP